MKDNLPLSLKWPALEGDRSDFPDEIDFGRAVWGKVHNAPSDFRWIAKSENFNIQNIPLEREFFLGSEDTPERCYFWRVIGNSCYAGNCYPSNATDAAGRSGFLEKQIISWERSEKFPAALAMLMLLSQVSLYTDEIWWDHWDSDNWFDKNFFLRVKPGDLGPVSLSSPELNTILEKGKAQLDPFVSYETLTEFYAGILAGNRGIPLSGLHTPISAEALAVLFLPLPREVVDNLSFVSWLPSKRADITALEEKWAVILSGEKTIKQSPKAKKPSGEHRRRSEMMARAFFDGDPEILAPGKTKTKGVKEGAEIKLALWGPSGSGKTMYLARLSSLNEYLVDGEKDWRVYLTSDSLDFSEDMDKRMKLNNKFPKGTSVGFREKIGYNFEHTTSKIHASLFVEDRAGSDFEEKIEEANKCLAEADGLILLIDPMRDKELMKFEISNTLKRLRADTGIKRGTEARPVAVCFTKADVLIKTPHDLLDATREPDAFMRRNLDSELLAQFKNYFTYYRFFPVSAAGVSSKRGVIEPTVFVDEKFEYRLSKRGRPVNLLSPFIWLIEKLRQGEYA